MPFYRSKDRTCKYCERPQKKNITAEGRNKGYLKTCGSSECLNQQYVLEHISKSKGRKGDLNVLWIEDRSKLKQKRSFTEERAFFKEVIAEKDYLCELTGLNGKLSVHHIDGVWQSPERRFDKSNCIVILHSIHKKFHFMYGYRTTEQDWNSFITNKEYEDCVSVVKKKNYYPFEDKTGKVVGRLTLLARENKKWKCLCECGNITYVTTGNLKSTKSCGCLKKEIDKIRIINNPIWKLSPIHKNKYDAIHFA